MLYPPTGTLTVANLSPAKLRHLYPKNQIHLLLGDPSGIKVHFTYLLSRRRKSVTGREKQMIRTFVRIMMVFAVVALTGPGWAEAAPKPVPAPPAANEPPVTSGGATPQACSLNLTYYYSPDLKGASWTTCAASADLAGIKFTQGRGLAGHGTNVKNNAASIRYTTLSGIRPSVFIYSNVNFKGIAATCTPGCQGNLGVLRNKNASHTFS